MTTARPTTLPIPPPLYPPQEGQEEEHHERKSGVTEAWWGLLEPFLFFLALRASPPHDSRYSTRAS